MNSTVCCIVVKYRDMDLARLKSLNSKLVSCLAFHPLFEFFIVEFYDFSFPCCIERRAALRGGGASCIRALARQPAADEAALQSEIMKNHSNNSSSLLLVVCLYTPILCQCLLAQDGDLEGVQKMVRRGIVFHMKRVTPEQGTPSPSPS